MNIDEFVEQLRDIKERFIFQGGSEYAKELADKLEQMQKRIKELEHENHVLDIEYGDVHDSYVYYKNLYIEAHGHNAGLREALESCFTKWGGSK